MTASGKLVIATWLFALSAWAQTSGGGLSGRVTDGKGAPIPSAVIIITDTSGGEPRQVVASADGTFAIPSLAPGTYKVELESGGTRRASAQTIQITGDANSTVTLTFGEAAGAEGTGRVELTGTSPTLQTESAEVSRSYGTRIVRTLPVIDRQYQELIGLMPGISPPVQNQDRVLDPQRRREFNVNGQPSYANAAHQDGSYQNEPYSGNAIRVLPDEAVQQLDIRTSNYNAENGFAAGAWNNVVTRPGQNQVHGSAFGFHTNNWLSTRNPLNTSDFPDARYNVNQFGGTLGGPVIANRLFIFGSYDGFLRRGRTTQLTTVPTDGFRDGDFSGAGAVIYNPLTGASNGAGRLPYPGNMIPASQYNPLAASILGYLPTANLSGSVNNLVGNPTLRDSTHRGDLKIDHRFSDNTTGFFRYGLTHTNIQRGSVLGLLGDAADAGLRNHSAVASVSHNLTSSMTGELRVGYSRYRNRINPWTDPALNSSLPGLAFPNGLPEITVAGFGTLGLPGNYPSRSVNDTYDGSTNWIWHTGMHRLKFGATARQSRASGFDAGFFSPRGSFYFGPGATSIPGGLDSSNLAANSFAAFLTGSPSQAGVSSFDMAPTYRQWQFAGYLTDTINISQKLYLEIGARYEVYSPIRTRWAGSAGVFDPVTNTYTPQVRDRDYDLNNIAPRVGIAYRPTSRVVVRGGYGIQYFPVPFMLAGVNQAATGIQTGLANGFTTTPFALPVTANPIDPTIAVNRPLYVTSDSAQTPYVQTYSLMVQSDLSQGFLLDIGYVGTAGRQLPYSTQLNYALPGMGVAGMPYGDRTAGIWERNTGLNSNYNSLQVNLTKRFANNLAFAAAYTFGKALDYGYQQSVPYDRRANYGPADWDRRHTLALSHVWQLPFGKGTPYFNEGVAATILGNWELNGVLRWATGTPYSVTLDPTFCNCPGVNSIRANYAGGGSFDGATSFDTNQFTSSANLAGTLGRNTFRGPDLFSYDVALFKSFAVNENIKLELRGEGYNITNSSNYANPVSFAGGAGYGTSTQLFNAMPGRRFQVAARMVF